MKNENKKTSITDKREIAKSITILMLCGLFIYIIVLTLKYLYKNIVILFSELSKLDAIVIVAVISASVSIIGYIINSVVGKRLEYKKSRNEYLAQKREGPYGEFIDMVYKLQEKSKNGNSYSNEDMIKDISKFSKQITLWGSPKVANKWNEFRKSSIENPNNASNNLLLIEEIMNEMRKDLGTKKIDKGGLLSFFINDVDKIL